MSTHLGALLCWKRSELERYELKKRLADPHWARLKTYAQGVILIKQGIYKKNPSAIEAYLSAARPEIDLGTDGHLTPQDWVGRLRRHFETRGFIVG